VLTFALTQMRRCV